MRHAARIAAFAFVCSPLLALSACGSQEISVSKSDPYYKGAEIFSQRCAGCHSLDVVGAHGSNVKASDKEITDGPNFNQRKETEANVLYALRNGGFSGKIMPANIVTGAEAEAVARFLAKYAGQDAANPAAPTRSAPTESTTPGAPADGKELGGSGAPTTTPDPAVETTPGTAGEGPTQDQESSNE